MLLQCRRGNFEKFPFESNYCRANAHRETVAPRARRIVSIILVGGWTHNIHNIMIPFQRFLLSLSACAALVFLVPLSSQSQNRVAFSLQNRGIVEGLYHAELWATVSSGATWTVGNCLINIKFNTSGLSIGSLNNVGVFNADPALSGGSYFPMTQGAYGNSLSLNIINFSGSFASKTGSFRIGTLRWQVLNGFEQDSLALYTPQSGPDSSIIMHGWETLFYSCGDTVCYTAAAPQPLQIGSPAVITSQPQAQTPCVGTATQFGIAGTGAQLTYQWQKLNGSLWQDIQGATASTLVFGTVSSADSGSYRVVLTGDSPPVATSNVVTLLPYTAPNITGQPVDGSVCNGESVTFIAQVAGTPAPAITWESSVDGGMTWQSVTGATSSTLVLSSVSASMGGYRYRAVATSPCGVVISNTALLSVFMPPTIISGPQATVVTTGATASMSAVATGTNLTYQWQKNFVNISGATNAALTIANAQPADIALYRVIASGACAPPDTSDNAVLFVQAPNNNLTTLNVKVFMQGYWNGTKHVRTPISVEIRSGATPISSALTALQTGLLSSNGTISVAFSNVSAGNYWIVVRHGGYLPIASGSAVSLSPGSTVDYDFTDAAAKAYTNSTISVFIGGMQYYVLKGGDLNGDIAVNPNDFPHLLTGYSKTNAVSIPGL